jgi:hypothetical protein
MNAVHAVTVLFSIDERTDEHLQTVEAVKGEVWSWLGHLGAVVTRIQVGSLPPSAGLSPQDLAGCQYKFMNDMQRSQQIQKGALAAWLDTRPEDKQ